MKKILYITIISLLIGACDDEERVFDTTPDERRAAAISSFEEALTSAPNGWEIQYFPSGEDGGGYTFHARFSKEGQVTLKSDRFPSFATDAAAATSAYSLQLLQGVVLVFETDNAQWHPLAEGGNAFFASAENEIILEKIEGDVIFGRGKVNGNEVKFIKASSEFEANLENFFEAESILSAGESVFQLIEVEGSTDAGIWLDYNAVLTSISLKTINVHSAEGTEERGIYYREGGGICFSKPIDFDGIEVQCFSVDETNMELVAEEDNRVRIVSSKEPPFVLSRSLGILNEGSSDRLNFWVGGTFDNMLQQSSSRFRDFFFSTVGATGFQPTSIVLDSLRGASDKKNLIFETLNLSDESTDQATFRVVQTINNGKIFYKLDDTFAGQPDLAVWEARLGGFLDFFLSEEGLYLQATTDLGYVNPNFSFANTYWLISAENPSLAMDLFYTFSE